MLNSKVSFESLISWNYSILCQYYSNTQNVEGKHNKNVPNCEKVLRWGWGGAKLHSLQLMNIDYFHMKGGGGIFRLDVA